MTFHSPSTFHLLTASGSAAARSARPVQQTLGEVGAARIRRRAVSLQNRLQPRISAACQGKNCAACFSLNCTHECHPKVPR